MRPIELKDNSAVLTNGKLASLVGANLTTDLIGSSGILNILCPHPGTITAGTRHAFEKIDANRYLLVWKNHSPARIEAAVVQYDPATNVITSGAVAPHTADASTDIGMTLTKMSDAPDDSGNERFVLAFSRGSTFLAVPITVNGLTTTFGTELTLPGSTPRSIGAIKNNSTEMTVFAEYSTSAFLRAFVVTINPLSGAITAGTSVSISTDANTATGNGSRVVKVSDSPLKYMVTTLSGTPTVGPYFHVVTVSGTTVTVNRANQFNVNFVENENANASVLVSLAGGKALYIYTELVNATVGRWLKAVVLTVGSDDTVSFGQLNVIETPTTGLFSSISSATLDNGNILLRSGSGSTHVLYELTVNAETGVVSVVNRFANMDEALREETAVYGHRRFGKISGDKFAYMTYRNSKIMFGVLDYAKIKSKPVGIAKNPTTAAVNFVLTGLAGLQVGKKYVIDPTTGQPRLKKSFEATVLPPVAEIDLIAISPTELLVRKVG